MTKFQQQVKNKLDSIDKTNKEEVMQFVKDSLSIIAFDYEQRFGFPFEIFKEQFDNKNLNGAEALIFVLNYIN